MPLHLLTPFIHLGHLGLLEYSLVEHVFVTEHEQLSISLVGGRPINFEGRPPPSQSVFGACIILTYHILHCFINYLK